MSKLERWLTLGANLSVVVGIVFLVLQMRQNTEAIRSQTRDSITEKQMEYAGWIATNRELADIFRRGRQNLGQLDPTQITMFSLLAGAILREGENSHYQYERGLFTAEEYDARWVRYEDLMSDLGFQQYWASQREVFSPSFREAIDRIVAEVGQAQ